MRTLETGNPKPQTEPRRRLPSPKWLAVTALALAVWAAALLLWWSQIQEARQAALPVPAARPTPVATVQPGATASPTARGTPITVAVVRAPGARVAAEDWLALAQAFDVEHALSHIAELTQLKYAGRAVGSPGGKLAAEWIAARFAEYGLQPAGDNGTYFQEFPVPYAELTAMPTFALLDSAGQVQKEYRLRQDYAFWLGGYADGGQAEGPVVWVGDGRHEDYRDLDVQGAIILCRWRYPLQDPLRQALEHGAGAILFFRPDYDFRFRRTAREDPLLPQGIPTLLIGSTVLEDLLAGSGLTASDLAVQFQSRPLATRVRVVLPLQYDQTATGRNVLGVLPGSDADGQSQIVVLGAHYDHLGADPDGTTWVGANDNASGVAVLLEIARQWQAEGYVPKRSVLFAAWDGEEIGLNGSRFYVQHPSYPLSDTVGMLQLDMVGAGPNDLLIDPGGLVADQSFACAATLGIAAQGESMGGSDHTSFVQAGVPATLYIWWDGKTPGVVYHVPEDGLSNINPQQLRAAGQLTDLVLLTLSADAEKLEDLAQQVEQAIATRDVTAFLATLDPQQDGLRQEQQAWLTALSARQPAEFAVSSSAALVCGDAATSTLTIRYRWREGDAAASASLPVRWVRYDGTWYYAGPAWKELSGGGVRVQYLQQAERAAQVLAIAANYRAQLTAEQGLDLPDPLSIRLYDTLPQLQALDAAPPGQEEAGNWVHDSRVLLSQPQALTVTLTELAVQRAGWSPQAASWLAEGLSGARQAAQSPGARQQIEAEYIPLLLEAERSGSLWSDQDMPSRWAQIPSDKRPLWSAQAWAMTQALLDAGQLRHPATNLALWRTAYLAPWRAAADGIGHTLAQRAAAVLQRDVAAFLATVNDANPTLYVEEQHWFADLADHPAKSFSLEGQLLGLQGDQALVHLHLNYQLDSDPKPTTVTWQARFVQRGGRWLYGDADFSEATSQHFRLRYGALWGNHRAQQLLAAAERAYDIVTQDLSVDLPTPIDIKYYDNPDLFRVSIFLSMIPARGWNEPGESIKLTNTPLEDVGRLIAHELTHKALFAKGVLHGGVHEGTAQYEAALYDPQWRYEQVRRWRQQVYDFVRSQRAITLADLSDWRDWQDELGLMYNIGWDIVTYFRERYGRETFLRWLDALGSNLPFEQAFLQATGTSFASFDAAWRESALRDHIPAAAIAAAQAFDAEAALAHVHALAQPEWAGREAGTPGNEAAAAYIAARFAEYGLQPAGDDGTYFQRFPISSTRLVTTPSLTLVTPDGVPYTLRYRLDWREVLGGQAGGGQLAQNLLYARDPNLGERELAGRVLLMRAGSDPLRDAQQAAAHGAGALLLTTNKWSADMRAKSNRVPDLANSAIPACELTREAADLIFSLARYSAAQMEKAPALFALPLSAQVSIELETVTATAANVLGVLPGSDPQLANEVLVLAAHLDHVGALPDGTVYPGANNDASGVAGLLEIARLWHEQGYRPQRTILFAVWNGSELGGVGANYYVAHPACPLAQTRAVVYLDMVGQGRGYYIQVGAEERRDALLLAHLEPAARQVEGRLTGVKATAEGDADAFRAPGIPTTVLTWERPEYVNEPGDTADLIDPKKLHAVGRVVALALRTLADQTRSATAEVCP